MSFDLHDAPKCREEILQGAECVTGEKPKVGSLYSTAMGRMLSPTERCLKDGPPLWDQFSATRTEKQ